MKALIISLFVLCIVIVIGLAIAGYVKQDENARTVTDGLLQFLDEDIRILEKKKIELEQGKVDLEIQKIEDQQATIPFKRAFKNYGSIVALATVLLCVVVVAIAYHKKLTTHILRIGKHSQIPIRNRDLSRISPEVSMSLSLAEQLKEQGKSTEKVFELYEKTARVLNQQLSIIIGKQGLSRLIDVTPEQPTLPAPKIPSFSELLRSGEIAPGKPLIFGYNERGYPRTGTWIDLFSSAVGGQSGQGKTATLRNIIAQSLITGEVDTFWIIDYHYPHPKSLLASLGALKNLPSMRYAETHFDTLEILEEVNATIDRRLEGIEPSYPVKVLFIDEVIILCKNCPRAVEIIFRIASESRKAGVYGLFSAQVWKADKIGDSSVRDCLTSRFAHKMQPRQANLLLQDSEQSKQVKGLTTGQALFSPVNGPAEILSIPFCGPADMGAVCELVGNTVKKARPEQTLKPHGSVQLIPNPELSKVDEELSKLSKSNVIALRPKVQQKNAPHQRREDKTEKESIDTLPTPELTTELLKANYKASLSLRFSQGKIKQLFCF